MANTISSALPNTITRDALFLFELFRDSPTPILIHIGPYANKTGAKPNTIIKRIAGIKQRNGLNISTTLGDYVRPPVTSAVGGEVKSKVKKERKVINPRKSGAEPVKFDVIPAQQHLSPFGREGHSPSLSSYSGSSESVGSVLTPNPVMATPQVYPSLKRSFDETQTDEDLVYDVAVKKLKEDLE